MASFESINQARNNFMRNHERRMEELNSAIEKLSDPKVPIEKNNQQIEQINKILEDL